MTMKFQVGQKVLVEYDADEWYDAEILEYNSKKKEYKVKYEDETEEWVNPKEKAIELPSEEAEEEEEEEEAGKATDEKDDEQKDDNEKNQNSGNETNQEGEQEFFSEEASKPRHTLIINILGEEFVQESEVGDAYNFGTTNEDGEIVFMNAFEIFFLNEKQKQIRTKLVFAPEFNEAFRVILTDEEKDNLMFIKFETKDKLIKRVVDVSKMGVLNGKMYDEYFEYNHNNGKHKIKIQVNYIAVSLMELSNKIKYSIRGEKKTPGKKEKDWNDEYPVFKQVKTWLNNHEDEWLMKNKDLIHEFAEKLYNGDFDWDRYSIPNVSMVESLHNKSDTTTYDEHRKVFEEYLYSLEDVPPEKFRLYYDLELSMFYFEECEKNCQVGGCDVSNYVRLIFRAVILNDVVLKVESEFNIYRSFIVSQDSQKIAMSLLGLILQISLTAAILINFVQGVQEDGFKTYFVANENQTTVDAIVKVVISLLVFSLVSYKHKFTVEAFCGFYEWASCLYSIPKYLKYADFISNVLIGFIITFLSFFFLVTSESFSDLVLNAFALTFLTEIDDMINVFESDAEILIGEDLQRYRDELYPFQVEVSYKWSDFLPIFGAPFATAQSVKQLWDSRNLI